MVRDILEAQRKMNTEDGETLRSWGRSSSSTQFANNADSPTQDPESAMLMAAINLPWLEACFSVTCSGAGGFTLIMKLRHQRHRD